MNVLIDMPKYGPLLDVLKEIPRIKIELIAEPKEESRVLPKEQIENCEVLFCTFPPKNYQLMPHLKMIQISSSGYAQVVGKGFEEKGVRVCNARGIFDIQIAEWNIAMMINLLRDIRGLIYNQEHGIWDRSPRFQKEIRGSTVGIWGYGGIGRETARLAKSLGMKVHVLVRREIQQRINTYCVHGTGDMDGKLPDRVFLMNEKAQFLSELDFLIMAIPQTKENLNSVGDLEFEMLPNKAFLLNPARGPLVNEQSLVRALNEGRIAGAALDTHYYYPMPSDHPLWRMPNVIMTPHIAGSNGGTKFLERIWDIFVENVKRIYNNEPLLNELSTEQIKG